MPLKGTTPTSQKAPSGHQGSSSSGVVTLALSGGSSQQGGGTAQPFTFPIRPENFQFDWPARQTVTQTINGAYQDHWGNGIGHIMISGHTGWRAHGESQDDGFKQFMKLREIHDKYCQMCGDTRPEDVTLDLVVAVPQGFGHYRVSSDNFKTLKNTQNPLLYRYEIAFTVLKDLGSETSASGPSQDSLFSNNVTTLGKVADSASTFMQFSNSFIGIADSLLPQQTYQYVIQPGDTIQLLANNLLGNVKYTTLIRQVNPSQALDTLIAGTIIDIPIIGEVT